MLLSSHRDSFSKHLFFFSRSNLFYRVYRTDMFYQARRVYPAVSVVEHTLSSYWNRNTYEFSRGLFFLIEQISTFQEPLFSHRTDIYFPESPIYPSNTYYFPGDPLCLEQIGIFQEGAPVEQIISSICLGGCFP